MLKVYRYRLYPTLDQEALLAASFGAVRYAHNSALAYRSKAYRRRGESVSYGDTVRLLNMLKKAKPWLGTAYSQSLQMALRCLDAAFTNFFRNPAEIGYPRFWTKQGRQTLQYPQGVKADFRHAALFFPKLGWVPCVFHRRFSGTVKTVTLRKEKSGAYHASVLVETEDAPAPEPQPVESENDILGIDIGVKTLAVCSDGSAYANPKFLAASEDRLRKEQKSLSRKKKDSKNREKQRQRVAKISEKIANQRKDAIEKATSEIAGKSQTAVAAETLNVEGMLQNRCLAKSVSDSSMSYFLRRLEDKCRASGKVFVKVNRWYPSSQTCSACGYVNTEVKDLSIREWECPECHTCHDRDGNAALNIAREGYRLITRLPMDGGEVTPVERAAIRQDDESPAATGFAEAGRVPENDEGSPEAPCL